MHTITITISEPVWQAIASRGKFGETEDDVLRRVFSLPPNSDLNEGQESRQMRPGITPRVARRRSFATNRMSCYLSDNQLHISFAAGAAKSWALPAKADKAALRTMREKAITFARENGATEGQVAAVKKSLTEAGYHLTR